MLILVGLGVLWAVVLLPPLVRRSGAPPVARPGRALVAVGGRAPSRHRGLPQAASSVPSSARDARRRRRDVLLALGGIATLTLMAAMAVGSVLWMVHFLADVVLVGYAVMLTMRYQRAVERTETIVPFRPSSAVMANSMGAPAGVAMRDEAVLRRQAN